jgi:hypothetical protein
MAFKAKVLGREALMKKLEKITPGATEAAAEAKIEAAKEAASLISAAAPYETGEYMESIQGGRQADHPDAHRIGTSTSSKDPDATGVYADYIWRFLEFGTAPHKIAAKAKPRLVFRGKDGRFVSKKSVEHPGGHAEPHVFPTWSEFRPEAKKMINKAVNDAVKRSLGK